MSGMSVKIALGTLLVLLLLGLIYVGIETRAFERLTDRERLERLVLAAGAFGPLALVLLLALAIVVSPLPSAPIGMVAGALYGSVWGTLLTIAGSCLGATTAFLLARFLAYDAVRRWRLVQRPLEWLESGHSQSWLMTAVFLTRLAPFLSFDAISYAAGLTPLTFWRFLMATLLGVAPISFLLAYGGGVVVISDANPVIALLVFGGVTAIPIAVRGLWLGIRRWRGRREGR